MSADAESLILNTSFASSSESFEGAPLETIADPVESESEQPKMPDFGVWLMTDGQLDPEVAKYIDVSTLIEEDDRTLPESMVRRFMAARALVYAAELTSPERMSWPKEHDRISHEMLAPAAVYASFLNDPQLAMLKTAAEGLVSPMIDALDVMYHQGLHRDSYVVAEAAIRIINLKQCGDIDKIPEAYDLKNKRHALPRL